MKLSLAPLLILLFTGIRSTSQETKKVVERSHDNISNWDIKYFVLKDHRDVKHGPFTYYNNGKLFVSGYYKNGKKDSIWHRYDAEGRIVATKRYTDNIRTGSWEFYNPKGTIEWAYNFSNDSAFKLPKPVREYVYLAADSRWVEAKTDREPVNLCAKLDWQYFLNRNLRYPREAIDKGQQGKGVVDVTVDENGEPIDYSVSMESDFPILGEEAMRIVKMFDPEFLPAVKDGKKVKIRVPVQVVFRLGGVR